LTAPAFTADQARLLFQRDDLTQPATAYPSQTVSRYPSRVEGSRLDDSDRRVLIDDARLGAPAPNGEVTFVRTNRAGTALLVQSAAGQQRVFVEPGQFADIGSPRYSPSGDRIAFVATRTGRATAPPSFPLLVALLPAPAFAHGLPWDLWLISADGTDLRRLAALGADDASLAWSPDAGAIFIYADAGSFVVDLGTGNVQRMPQFAGDGGIAWLTSIVPPR